MNTKEMNINELEMINGGEDIGKILLKPGVPINPVGPILPNFCPLTTPTEIPLDEGPTSVPAPAPLTLGDLVCFTMR